jgi:hypothetical protein
MLNQSKHLFILLSVLFLTACSSNPSQDVATKVCQSFLSADLHEMQEHMSEEAKIDIAERRTYIEKFFKSDPYTKMIADVVCEKPSSVRDLSDGRKIFYFGTQLKIKLKELDGTWKMVR